MIFLEKIINASLVKRSMNQKQIAIIIFIIGVLLAVFVVMAKSREDAGVEMLIQEQGGSCYLDDGTCLHEDRDFALFILGGILAGALVILGVYLYFFDKTQELLYKHQKEVSSALKEAKKKDEFKAFLSGFNDEERAVLSAIKEQDGITQSTLRYRTGMSKTGLSLLLKDLEGKTIISRKKAGKSNAVYLRKKF